MENVNCLCRPQRMKAEINWTGAKTANNKSKQMSTPKIYIKKNPIKNILINCTYFNIIRGSCAVVHFRIEKKNATRPITNTNPLFRIFFRKMIQNLAIEKYQAKKFLPRFACNVFEFKRN